MGFSGSAGELLRHVDPEDLVLAIAVLRDDSSDRVLHEVPEFAESSIERETDFDAGPL